MPVSWVLLAELCTSAFLAPTSVLYGRLSFPCGNIAERWCKLLDIQVWLLQGNPPFPHYPQAQFHIVDEAIGAANVKDTTIIRVQDVLPLPKIPVKVKVIEPLAEALCF